MRFFHRIPLSLRVPLLTVVLMLLVGVFASQQVLRTLENVQNARIRELAHLRIEALSVALGPLVLRKDVWEVYDMLVRTMDESEVRRLNFTAVADETGHVLAATDTRRAPLDSLIADVAQGAQDLDNLSLAGKVSHIRLLSDLVYQDRVVGQILTEMNVSDLFSQRRQAARLLLVGNAIVTGFLALLGYLGMRWMLLPVTRIIDRMRASSEAPVPIPASELPSGDTELARLARSYNAMANAVEAKAEADRRLAERERFVSLGRLSSSLAHEINNPLGGLLNAADTITKFADRPEVVRDSAELLTRGLRHLRDVAGATLDLYRMDRGQAPLSREDFDDLRLLVAPEIVRSTQQLDWHVALSSPELAGFASVPVRQIALNLLLNATAAAGDRGRVGLNVSGTQTGVTLEISNSGPGLSDHARERLLGAGPVPPGGGVGLRLVRDLVAELNGTISLDDTPEQTVIRIVLPALPERTGGC